VAKKLTGLVFETDQPVEAGSLIKSAEDKEIGRLTSATFSPKLKTTVGLGYVRYEHLTPGTPILIGNVAASVQSLPLIHGSWYEN
jgi:glycine cleavage system aminomethyltransferase T